MKDKKIKILIVRVGEKPKIEEVNRELEVYQKIVGGYIECCYPFDDEVALVCNDSGKIDNLPLNRLVVSDYGNIDIIAGDFFIVGTPANTDDFESLNENQLEKYKNLFAL